MVSECLHVVNIMDESIRKGIKENDYELCKNALQENQAVTDLKIDFYSLLKAANQEKIDVVRKLLDHTTDVNTKSKYGESLLHYAAGNNNLELVQLLLDYKADVNLTSSKRISPLVYAAKNNNLEIVKILLEHGADSNATLWYSGTPLCYAAENNNLEMVRLLLTHKAEVNDAALASLATPLHAAANIGSKEIVTLLFKNGANPQLANKKGETAFHLGDRFRGDFGSWMRREEKCVHHMKLMRSGTVQIKKANIFLSGNPDSGKSVLKKALKTGLLTSLFVSEKEGEKGANREATPGVEIDEMSIKGCGVVYCWDFAGQSPYHLSHSFFLGNRLAVNCVLYDITQRDGAQQSVLAWLKLLKSAQQTTENGVNIPRVILVATHADIAENEGWIDEAKDLARRIVDETRKLFSGFMIISNAAILLTSFESQCAGMTDLRDTLSRFVDEVKKGNIIPKICQEMLNKRGGWVKECGPFLYWSELLANVEKDIDPEKLVDEELLLEACQYLSDVGEIYFAKLNKDEKVVVLKPSWLGSEVCGPMLASSEDQVKYKKYNAVTPKELFTPDDMDTIFRGQNVGAVIQLLEHLYLVYYLPERGYLIPGILPLKMPAIKWKTNEGCVSYGIKLICKDEISSFSGAFFPTLQVQILQPRSQQPPLLLDSKFNITRLALKVVVSTNNVEGLIHFTPDRSALYVLTKVDSTKYAKECYLLLTKLKVIMKQRMEELSPGTDAELQFLSPRELRRQVVDDSIDESFFNSITSFREDEIETNQTTYTQNKVWNKRLSIYEDVNDFQWHCDFSETDLQDLADDIGTEWRAIGIRLDVTNAKLEQIRSDNPHSLVDCIFNVLCVAQKADPDSFRQRLLEALKSSGRTDLAHLFFSRSFKMNEGAETKLTEDISEGTPQGSTSFSSSSSSSSSSTSLNKLNENDVLNIACRIGTKWNQIGIRLGVTHSQLARLREDNKHDVQNAIFNMLMFAMQSSASGDFERKLANALIQSDCAYIVKEFRLQE